MTKPKVVQAFFEAVDLKAGTYLWCACGESKTQPFCDGSHAGTEFQPRTLVLKEDARIKLCLCKQTKSVSGLCDGSHTGL